MPQINQTISAAGVWLLEHQDMKSGGWPDRPGGHVNVLNTAEAVISLIDSDHCQAGEKPIRDAVTYLNHQQTKDGPDKGCWPRIVSDTIHIPDLVRTSFAIKALYRAGVGGSDNPVKDAVDWLFQLRDENGGWRFHRTGTVEFMPTCFALTALLESYADCTDTCQNQTRDSLQWLIDKYYNGGGDENRGAFGPPGPLRGVHTIYGGLVLQLARLHGIGGYQEQEEHAIDWLLRHPDDAIKLREEWLEIDPANDGGNYGFMFMTDTLLIRLLMGSDNKGNRTSKLSLNAMLNLKDKVDENSGAFYGSRVFSWSTAKAVSALCVVQKHAGSEFPLFPQREPEYKGQKVGPVVVGFACVLSLIAFNLMREGKFGLLEFGFFVFMMLATLLAYGSIREKTFKELFSSILNRLKS